MAVGPRAWPAARSPTLSPLMRLLLIGLVVAVVVFLATNGHVLFLPLLLFLPSACSGIGAVAGTEGNPKAYLRRDAWRGVSLIRRRPPRPVSQIPPLLLIRRGWVGTA